LSDRSGRREPDTVATSDDVATTSSRLAGDGGEPVSSCSVARPLDPLLAGPGNPTIHRVSEGLHGWQADPFGRHEERWISEGKPTGLVRDGGFETREPVGDEDVPPHPVPTGAEPSGHVDPLPAEEPALWLSSHSGWKKWSRWSNGTPLRSVYQEGATERRRLVAKLLDPGEEVLSDGPAYRVGGPGSDESDEPSGHLLVATKRLIFVPEDERVLPLRYSQLRSVAFVKQKSGWITAELSTDTGAHWSIVVLPRTMRLARKLLKKENPGALR
jgi:hypothetical protein